MAARPHAGAGRAAGAAARRSPGARLRGAVALLLACASWGCLYHEGMLRVRPPAQDKAHARLSDEAVAMVTEAVIDVARSEGMDPKRGFSKPFVATLLARYTSPEQVSVTAWLARDGREIDIRIRDINHTRENSYTRSIRTQLETRIQAALPDHDLHYGTRRNP